MGSFSIWHWLIVLVIVLLIFGTKKLRNIGARPRRRGEGLQGRHEGRRGRQGEDRSGGEIAPPGTTIEGEVKDKQKS